MNKFLVLFMALLFANNVFGQNEIKKITLKDAVDSALSNNPALKAFNYEVSALDKIKIQAGLIPNPEIGFEAEDFLGSKELNGIKGSQFTLTGSQLFELGGKRSNRVELAQSQINSAQGEFELIKLNFIRDVKASFFELYRIYRQMELQKQFININEEILKTVSERVNAGRTSPAEESKVKVSFINSRIEFQRLQRNYESSRTKLNSLLGADLINGRQAEKNIVPSTNLFDTLLTLPNKNAILDDLENVPSIKNLNYEINFRKASLDLERSQAVPDLTVAGGIRYLNELKTNSFVAGLSIPLPFFNRNQGNIQAAEVKLEQMDDIIKARKLSVISSLNTFFNNLLSAYNNAVQLRDNVLPESENAYEITRQGYLQGRFAFIDLLDAQRTLFDTRAQYVLELSDYYNSMIELENITGKTFLK